MEAEKKHFLLAAEARRQGVHFLGAGERRARFESVDEIRLVLAHGARRRRHREAEWEPMSISGSRRNVQGHGAFEQHGDLLEEEAAAVEVFPDGAELAQDGGAGDAVDGDAELAD